MGVWGTGIFSDDTASDVREEYRELIGEGLPAHEATDKILRSFEQQRGEEMTVVWLALAATQWKCGRLEERVKATALEIIDSGADLKRWPDASIAGKRRSALGRLRAQLCSPQPAAKRIGKPYRSTCEWELGELVGYRLGSGNWIVFRVTGFSSDKGGVYPQCEILDWLGDTLPAGDQIAGFPVRIGNGRIKHGQVAIASAAAKEFPSHRVHRLNVKSEPSEASRIRVAFPQGGVGFKGGGLPYVLWRGLDRFLETEYGLK
jgi:hypothetical protein